MLARVRARLAAEEERPTPARVAAALRAEGRILGDRALLEVVESLRSEMVGAGPLDPFLRDPRVTDVLVNGPDSVWVDRGDGLERVAVRFRDEAAVRHLAQRLAALAGRRLDDAIPWCDAPLPDGVRFHAVLPPVARSGTALSLRVAARRAFTLPQLVSAGTVTAAGAGWLQALVSARLSFLVSGGTGSGKTTVLAALLGLVDPAHRLVVVEDTAELAPDHPHVVCLETRPPNVEGAGGVGLRDLLRQALRMRPDRVVVGEVRGSEVCDLLAAFNTGHEGACGTLHANTAVDVVARLEALSALGGMSREALHAQVAAGLDAVVHLGRGPGGRRVVDTVGVLRREGADHVSVVPAVRLHPEVALAEAAPALVRRLGRFAPQPG
ncbi:MAG TPA: TadA family conjugal transfer-associated ATPase [Actinomycetes bacterium]|nr:TadA family conjugal transfer-associated ATPase [Actinomycetes bacterium]